MTTPGPPNITNAILQGESGRFVVDHGKGKSCCYCTYSSSTCMFPAVSRQFFRFSAEANQLSDEANQYAAEAKQGLRVAWFSI